jgi:excisionase family DNA binding protein
VETTTPWLRIKEAAAYARCGRKLLYREIAAGRLRAARVGGRREIRLRQQWIDDWLEATTRIVEQPAAKPRLLFDKKAA